MQLHQLKPKTGRRRGQRIGRGGKRGTTSGRGTKGQRARAGHKIRPALRDIIKKIPKRRGYRFRPFRTPAIAIDMRRIMEHFPDGSLVTPATLLEKKLLRRIKGKVPVVKILSGGDAKKKLSFRGIRMSAAARARVEAVGGSVVL